MRLFALSRHFDKLFYNSHSLRRIRLRNDLAYRPHHLAVHLQTIQLITTIEIIVYRYRERERERERENAQVQTLETKVT